MEVNDSRIRYPPSNFGWLWRRLRLKSRLHRRSGPCLGVIYGSIENLGDRALAYGLIRALAGCHIEPYIFRSKENFLARLGLSGSHIFDGVVLGGGTLINQMGAWMVRNALDQHLRVWTMGTGAGGGSYLLPERPDLSEWIPLLPRCEAVTVRGPLSVANLEEIGFYKATVLGDLALVLTSESLPDPGPPSVCAVNVIKPRDSPSAEWTSEHLAGLAAAVRRLAAEGCQFKPFAMLEGDREATQQLLARAGLPNVDVFYPAKVDKLKEYLSECGFAVAMRLHGGVLATCIGLPTAYLGYMDKTLDFALSIGLERFHIPIQQASADAIWEKLQLVRNLKGEGRRELWQTALNARRRIEEFASSIRADLRHNPTSVF